MKKIILTLCVIGACLALGCNDSNDSQSDAFSATKHAMINGTTDPATAHYGVVGLFNTKDKYIFCTGTLIHPQWVLTAAHCVTSINDKTADISPSNDNQYIKIGVGKDIEKVYSNLYPIAGTAFIHYHKDFGAYALNIDPNYTSIENDIALIKLANPIPENIVKPILPLPKWLALNSSDMSQNMVFSGYGFDSEANLGTKLKFTGNITKYCGPGNAADKDYGCKEKTYKISGCHPAHQISAEYKCYDETEYVLMPYGSFFYEQKDGGPCQGDSGGPALFTLGDVEYIAGVTSFGDPICAYYGISTAVQDYYDWIISYAPEVATQYTEICGNGYDDDGDGIIDNGCGDDSGICGDGILSGSEKCDNDVFFNNATACSKWNSAYESGNVKCNSDCTIDYSECIKIQLCGNNAIDAGEMCDGNLIRDNEKLCKTWNASYKSGAVKCNNCQIDYSNCSPNSSVFEICDDGIDNDENGSSDCLDPVCINSPICTDLCSNKLDDDADGKIDCDDDDCQNNPVCLNTCPVTTDAYGNQTIANCALPACQDYLECYFRSSGGICSATPLASKSPLSAALILLALSLSSLIWRRKKQL